MSPSDVVFIENSNKSEDTLSIMNHYSDTSVEMGNNDILGENNENKKVDKILIAKQKKRTDWIEV